MMVVFVLGVMIGFAIGFCHWFCRSFVDRPGRNFTTGEEFASLCEEKGTAVQFEGRVYFDFDTYGIGDDMSAGAARATVVNINRAFNARVDAEVKKAVGEFRTRAVLVAIDHPKYCHGLTVQDCCEMIADGIRALPTT